MKNKSYILFLILALVISCQKDRLTKEKEILVGTWDWDYTVLWDYCDGFIQTNVISPATENETYKVEFLKKGLIRFYKNEVITNEHNVVFHHVDIPEGGIVESNKEIYVILYLDGDEEKSLTIKGTPKEMVFMYYPHSNINECVFGVKNYLKKRY